MPSSRPASRLASFECSSSARVLTAGIVFCLCAEGGAECDIGGGDTDEGLFPYVPCRLNDTGLAVWGPGDELCCCMDVETASDGANGLFELAQASEKP